MCNDKFLVADNQQQATETPQKGPLSPSAAQTPSTPPGINVINIRKKIVLTILPYFNIAAKQRFYPLNSSIEKNVKDD